MAAVVENNESSVTRIYVAGLPPSTTKDQVRFHFAATGKYTITDAHVIPDRRIAFVGFTSHEQAKSAVQYFNKSFVRMSKISVTLAEPIQVKRDEKGQAIPLSGRDSRKRKRGPRDAGEHARMESNKQPLSIASVQITKPENEPKAVAEEKENHPQEQPFEGFAEDANSFEEPKSDMEWLRGKTKRTLDLLRETDVQTDRSITQPVGTDAFEKTDTDVEDIHNEQQPSNTNPTPEAPQKSSVTVPNARLFVRNLPFDTREDDLRAVFAPHGRISEIHLVTDTKKSTGKGLGYVQFVEPDDASNALVALDGRDLQGRLMHILPSTDKKTQKLTDFEVSKLPLKQQKAIKRKNESSTATFSWNSLYMNPDAVLASVADRLGVTKAELLDPASAEAAVKQAHAETSVIKETKDYLKIKGMNIDAMKNRTRDESTLLLKNFSFGTTSDELLQMLSQYGTVERLLFPPTGTMAVVQYRASSEATMALKQLAYRNLKGSVLFLEKAPAGLWDGPAPATAPGATKFAGDETDVVAGTTVTVFVRNLNFSTASGRLAEAFKPISGFLSARVKTRTDPNRPGEILSMGFGFVEFRTKSQAEAAIATMNGRRLDGHELLVQASQKAADLGEERRKEDTSKKLNSAKAKVVIKNLPFEATKKDVRALFSAYGQLRTVRMPKKFDNTARGFAFAEFLTAKEAENAIEALSNTHLLGRRLVLDFAEGEIVDPEAEIRAMEKKVQGHQETLTHHRMTGSARKKFNVDAREDFDPL